MSTNDDFKPLKRTDVLSKGVQDDLIVYDLANFQSHCLERSTAAIWEMCDGETTIDGMAQALKVSPDLVGLGLRRLHKAKLLESQRIPWKLAVSRRTLVKQLSALGGFALLSSALPTPAEAASKKAKCGYVCTKIAGCLKTGTCSNKVCCCSFGPGTGHYCFATAQCPKIGGKCL